MHGWDLCHSFRAAASTVFADYQAGRGLGLVPWETTFTDSSLLAIGRNHATSLYAHRFDGAMEAKTGTDWEWWIRSSAGIRGLRIQAKRRALATNSYGTTKKLGSVLQVDLLVKRAGVRSTTPLYCLYGDRVPMKSPPGTSVGPCPHGLYDPTTWGASLLSAHVVWAHERRLKRRPRPDLLHRAQPWHQLVCDWSTKAYSGNLITSVDAFLDAALVEAEGAAQGLLPPSLVEQGLAAIGDSRQRGADVTAPRDVLNAFEAADASLVTADRAVAGVVLIDAVA